MAEDHQNDTADVCIVHLTSSSKDRWNKIMAAAVLATGHRLYALFEGLRSIRASRDDGVCSSFWINRTILHS